MKKILIAVFILFVSTQLALAAGPVFKTKLYVYDADTAGDVTSNTNRLLVVLGLTKGEGYVTPVADQRVQGNSVSARDMFGAEAVFVSENRTPDAARVFALNSDGEEVRILGTFRKSNPSIKLRQVTTVNLSAEAVSSRGQSTSLKASTVVKLQ